MKQASGSSRSSGFTLIEAMAATLLMSFILFALAAVTGQWLPNWDRGLLQLQRANLLAVGLDRLTDDIAAAEYISAGSGQQALSEKPIFDGDELAITFVRSTLAPNDSSGLQVVRIAEISDHDRVVLVRSTAALPIGAGASGAIDDLLFADPVVLIGEPFRVSFSYAGLDREWRDTWQHQAHLPRAVRVQLRDAATSMLLAESTSTMVHAELPAYCAWPKNAIQCSTQ
jgi:general secretion pathway protein J